jgi:hypothetical protein
MVTTSSGPKRRLFLAVCTLLLLLAQHTALTHAVWHALDVTPAEHEHEHEHRPGTPKSAEGSLCAFHALIGQVLGGGGAPDTPCVLYAPSAKVALVDPGLRVVLAARFLAPLSRGPPALS